MHCSHPLTSIIQGLSILVLLLVLTACKPEKTLLETIQHQGELVVATRVGPTTYYQAFDQFTGFEYELAKQFADYLGVRLKIITYKDLGELLQALKNSDVHFAAAGLTITKERAQEFRFTSPYQQVSQQVIYQKNSLKPTNVQDLNDGPLVVMANSNHSEHLQRLKDNHNEINWTEKSNSTMLSMLNIVNDGQAAYTIVDSNIFDLHRSIFPELRSAFNIKDWEPLAWAFPPTPDTSLYATAENFFNKINHDGSLKAKKERFYGHRNFDYVGARTFIAHMDSRLPRYEEDFKSAAMELDIDWRLLAAVGYQESLWNPNAISPTGVRGLMMLTLQTAKEVGVTNRRDPKQSIAGGAFYLKKLLKRLPKNIQEPHRTWFALAAYNTGYGHIQDARILTKNKGEDPDNWFEVKPNLLLLKKRKYYQNTRHGYARGAGQSVLYVKNIRRYYNSLVWATEKTADYYVPVPQTTLAMLTPIAH
ncbi:MAG: membrane-bound lytic murein transglycosylase MltF [Moraxellaceae bacterium]|nr:MAG: membrane-bound lytic murein transglycosylase MltF [Moraxellaceae bacterium]